MDEQWSYAHANSTQGAYLSRDIDSYMKDAHNDISYKWLDAKIFHDYLTVQQAERFSYGHIGDNLKFVEHPPLYFIMLHTVCSFFPDMFNKWCGGTLNLIFFALTLVMLYKLSRLFFKDDIMALLPVFLWGFSEAGLATAMYLRMYMLQTFFAVCLVYETLNMLNENILDKRRLGKIFLFSALGILTQYNALFFSFFVTVSTSIILLYRKNWQLLFGYAFAMLCSVLVLFVVFPDALDVLLFSQRGSSLLSIFDRKNLSLLFFSRKFGILFDVYYMQFLCFRELSITAGVVTVLFLFMAVFQSGRNVDISWLCSFCAMVGVTMVCLMPTMWCFWLRYVMFLMPFAAILTIFLIYQGGNYLALSRKSVVVLLSILVVMHSLLVDFGKRSVFSFQGDAQTLTAVQQMQNKKILVVSPLWSFFSGSYFYKNSNGVFRTDDLCQSQEIIKEADMVLVYHAVAQDKRVSRQAKMCHCTEGLEFVSVIRHSADLEFDVYRVLEKN